MKKIIHLSDLHFRRGWEETQGVVLNAFFTDLNKQVGKLNPADLYVAFSGDVVLEGGDPELYDLFLNEFDKRLNQLNIPIGQRICVPGNHDISRDYLKTVLVEHEGVVSQNLSETKFNDYISNRPDVLTMKFKNYNRFEGRFAALGINGNTTSGAGWKIEDGIGVYCLNTALCSSAGLEKTDDSGRLAVDTRSLQKWLSDCTARTKILVMHHPIGFLTDWAQRELTTTFRNKFSLCLSGHVHEQSTYHILTNGGSFVQCSAPPLLTDKTDELGYAIISVTEGGVVDIQYRQWTKNQSFVTGVNFSDTDDGRVPISHDLVSLEDTLNDKITKLLEGRLQEALQSFSAQPIVWVEPVLSKTNEFSRNADDDTDNTVLVSDLISSPKSTIIKAPPQFGLTSLAYHLAREAWSHRSSLWLYLDSKSVKSNNVEKAVKKELDVFGVEMGRVGCIILDSWTNLEKDSLKVLTKLCQSFKNIPIIVMQTIDDFKFTGESQDEGTGREFDVIYLLALTRGHIRKVVAAYNEEKHIGEEDAVITKVVSDLETLNIHRTPLNCLTLLKVSEKYFDESPVNRTKMLEMVLFLLFDMDGIPKYKTKPDVKDCEYVLGRFCEQMIRLDRYSFSREYFLSELTEFCKENLLDLEVEVVFDILYSNRIIVKRDGDYCFRATYWILYFAARRMHQNQDFAQFVFQENRYTEFPEIVEFYTGIDRKREDALEILARDLRAIHDTVKNKVGLPDRMNPYKSAKWLPTPESLQKMQDEIGEDVLTSRLPDPVKDRYADRTYDPTRPYDQSIHRIFREYSLALLLQSMNAASRALRNSDYVSPKRKRDLLDEIMGCWEEMSKVLIALTPMLVTNHSATLEGLRFILIGDVEGSMDERIGRFLNAIPENVVSLFKDDLFSSKMGPLLFEQLAKEKNELRRHELVLLLIHERPREWKKHIENYIAVLSKDSFYLMDVIATLRNEYRYSFAAPRTVLEIVNLIKMGLAKNKLGIAKPGIDKIKQIPDSVLPKREPDHDVGRK